MNNYEAPEIKIISMEAQEKIATEPESVIPGDEGEY